MIFAPLLKSSQRFDKRSMCNSLKMVAVAPITVPSIVGPEWNNSEEYTGLSSSQIKQDLKLVENLITEMNAISSKIDLHYLDAALHQNRMAPATLRAMMTAIKEAEPMARRALTLQVSGLPSVDL